jgi:DNA-binding NtrC family response regulator
VKTGLQDVFLSGMAEDLSVDENIKHILLIEHEPYLGLTLGQALTLGLGSKVEVHVCDESEEAFSVASDTQIDLIITEYRLPGISGPELVTKIRAAQMDVPAVMLSEFGPEMLSKNDQQIINGFLTKPFELVRLFEMVQGILGIEMLRQGRPIYTNGRQNGRAKSVEAQPETIEKNMQAKTKKKILIMEDDAGLRRIYNKALSKGNFEVFEAGAIQTARDLLKSQRFDIFICDIHLGRERGTDLLVEMADKLDADGTQTIMCSAYGQYRFLTDEMGADYFLEKPISLGTLLQLINRLTETDQTSVN